VDVNHYEVIGGPGDGRKVLKVALPGMKQGEVRQVVTPDSPYTALLYRLNGETLIFVEASEIVVFRGGPLDGTVNSLAHLEDQGIAEGENLVCPLGGGRYAWYKRKGRELLFGHTCAEADMKPVGEQLREGPGLSIPPLPKEFLKAPEKLD
jgi:hypothetical protein